MPTSRHIQRKAARVALLVTAVLLALVCVPSLAWAASDTATITAPVRVFQEYRVSASGLQSTFDYMIVPLETGAPLPVDESGKSFDTFSLTRDADDWLTFPIEVTTSPSAEEIVYHYTLKPAEETLPDGLYYVDLQSTSLEPGVDVYYLELHVQLSSSDASAAIVTPTVHVEGWDGPKVTDPGWRISYTAPSASTNVSSQEKADTSQTAGSTTSTAGALAKTSDVLGMSLVAGCAACAGALLIAQALHRRRRAGDGHA